VRALVVTPALLLASVLGCSATIEGPSLVTDAPPADASGGHGATGVAGGSGGSGSSGAPSGNGGTAGAASGSSGSGGASGSGGGGGTSSTSDPPGPGACAGEPLAAPALRRLTAAEFVRTLDDAFPTARGAWTPRLSPDPTSSIGFDNDAALLVTTAVVAREVEETARDLARAVTSSSLLPALLPCSASQADRTCADEFLASAGRRLFRRTLVPDERTRYLDYFSSVAARADFPTALGWMLTALVASPSTLYRSELGRPSGGTRKLTGVEVASELAYAFSGGPPDAELLDRAESGGLDGEAARLEAADALLAVPRGKEALLRFFEQWSGAARIAVASRPSVAGFQAAKASMQEETRRFVTEVVLERGGGVRELLTAPYTFVDATLASFYGFGAPGSDFTLAERPAAWGVGLLAQASLLAGHAHSNGSSPTLRGLLVYERLLCNPRPAPPPGIPPLAAPSGATTTRARYESEHASGSCQGCHREFDPIGFGFEHFDEVGRYRETEAGLAIDASGALPGRDPALVFDGEAELAERLAALPEVSACVAGRLSSYWFGAAEGTSCIGSEAQAELTSGAIGLRDYAVRLAGAPSFGERSLE
jgi:hypothetical protein